MPISKQQKEAKSYAARYGFTCRRVQHSDQHPNGYIKIIDPKGVERAVSDWAQAKNLMMRLNVKGGAK